MRCLPLVIVLLLVLAPPASAMRWLDDPDTTPPVLTVPGPISVQTADPAGKVVHYDVSAADDTDPTPTILCDHDNDVMFTVGVTTITCTAQDASGNVSAPGFFTVTVELTDTTPPVLVAPSSVSQETEINADTSVVFSVSATDNVDGPVSVNCDHDSGSLFPIGTTTTVHCSATDSHGNIGSAQFDVTVTLIDHTNPLVNVPGPFSVETETNAPALVAYPFAPSATDNLDGSLAVDCDHDSGSLFSIGPTMVHCSAIDSHGNIGSAQFEVTVTLIDHTDPVVNVPGPFSVETETNAPALVAYPFAPSATDNLDGSLAVDCDHDSGSLFSIGPTMVHCSATDSHGNIGSAQFEVTVVLVDRTAPTLHNVPSSFAVETENPGGTAVTYAPPTATDNLDPSVSVSCVPVNGTNLPIGPTPVQCSATDSRGNHTSASFTITVALVDHTAPLLTGVADRGVEANGPSGSIVNFPTPTAVDAFDGPIAAVSCAPASGTKFPLGTTTVTCHATDAHGNAGTASFHVTVADTTPPALVIPVSRGVYATTADGIPRADATIATFLASASASDIVDPSPVVTNSAPVFLSLGTTDVNFTARDASGNATSRSSAIVVLPKPPPGTPPLVVPPAPKAPDNPKNVQAKPGDGSVRLAWAPVAGAKKYLVYRSESGQRRTTAVGQGQLVYTGTATTFTDRGLQNGIEYRYVVVAEDAAGNQSAGAAIVVVPRRDLLVSPKDGARLRKAPKLVWKRDAEADYYNAQLLLDGVKILSVWPTRGAFVLHKAWKFQGRTYKLKPGVYRWYVWPGYGARSAVDYGGLLGSRSFQIVR